MKIKKFYGIILSVIMIVVFNSMALAGDLLFEDYNVCEVHNFTVGPTTPAPDTSGGQIADKVVFQVRRYSEKFKFFDLIIKKGTHKIPAGKKVLIIKGQVKEYTEPTVGRRIGRNFMPGGEYTGTAYFAAHYQFIDKQTGKVIYETDLRTSSTGRNDTVDYAMLRNAEAAAKIIYANKTKK